MGNLDVFKRRVNGVVPIRYGRCDKSERVDMCASALIRGEWLAFRLLRPLREKPGLCLATDTEGTKVIRLD
jgi:hypothetical protein